MPSSRSTFARVGARAATLALLVLVVVVLSAPARASATSGAVARDGLVSAPARPALQDAIGGVAMQATAALGGYCDLGRWVQLDVRLANTGPALRTTVVVEVSGRATYRTAVELPRRADKIVPLFIPCATGRTRVIAYRGEGTDGPQLGQRDVGLRPLEGRGLVVVLGPPDYRADRAGGLARRSFYEAATVVVAPNALPERSLALASADHIVAVSDLGRLRAPQAEALYEWVALGGQLTVPGGQGAVAVLQSLPERLLPATPGDVVDGEIGPAVEIVVHDEEPLPEGGIGATPIVRLTPADDAEAEGDVNGAPLVVRRTVGEGAVVALAFDPSVPTATGWLRPDAVWAAAHTTRSDTAWVATAGGLPFLGESAAAIRRLPQFRQPPIALMAVLVMAYILAVGPLNYLRLRRRRRLDRAWITIPALSVAATVAMYAIGYWRFGNRVRWYELAVVRAVPEAGVAHVRGYVSIFSPNARRYSVDVGTALPYGQLEAVQGPMGGFASFGATPGDSAFDIVQGAQTTVEGLAIDQWDHDGVSYEAVIPWPEGPAAVLDVAGNAAHGDLPRPSDEVTGARLVVGGQEHRLTWSGGTSSVTVGGLDFGLHQHRGYGDSSFAGDMGGSYSSRPDADTLRSTNATRRFFVDALHREMFAGWSTIEMFVNQLPPLADRSPAGSLLQEDDWNGVGRLGPARTGLLTAESSRAPVPIRLRGVTAAPLVATLLTQRVALTGDVPDAQEGSGNVSPSSHGMAPQSGGAYPPPSGAAGTLGSTRLGTPGAAFGAATRIHLPILQRSDDPGPPVLPAVPPGVSPSGGYPPPDAPSPDVDGDGDQDGYPGPDEADAAAGTERPSDLAHNRARRRSGGGEA